jgi:multiple sugar transport system ATP-binding protein
MGRAIVRDPQVFLFDEPLSNLDAKLRVQMRTEIKELHQRLKTTSIYVTHDQIEAMTMADKIVVMRDGRVEQTGSPLELYDRPANQFVAGFIGSPAMNFLPGVLRRAGGAARVEFGEGTLAARAAAAPAAQDGQQVLYGTRPEHMQLAAADEGVPRGRGGGAHRRRHPGVQQARGRGAVTSVFRDRHEFRPAKSSGCARPGARPPVRRRQRRAAGPLGIPPPTRRQP